MEKNKTVEEFLSKHPKHEELLSRIRGLILSTELKETIKWGMPVYTVNNKNVIGMGAFKEYAGVWFYNGSLLEDKHQKLINAQEGKTQALRQWRISTLEELDETLLLAYIEEAIQNQKDGKEVKANLKKPLVLPEELTDLFEKDQQLQNAFDQLSLSKKREYTEYISEAKREATKIKRLEKITPMIIQGIGLNDKYR